MLTKEQFINLIDYPEQLNSEHQESLNTICNQFPYFVSSKLLLLKSLKNSDSINYEEQLHKTAAFVQNREVLYHLLMKEALQKNIQSVEIEDKAEVIPALTETTEQRSTASIEPVIKPINTPKESVSELEQLILEEALASSFAREYNFDEQQNNINENKTLEPIKSVAESEKSFNKNDKNSFTAWLTQINKSSTSTKEITQKPSVESIIDNFIQTEPRIGEPKKEFFSPENVARMSLIEDLDFVTETLAKIYAKQGNIPKAISAFNKLSLKYPEKSTYFAAQIKNLEQQLKK